MDDVIINPAKNLISLSPLKPFSSCDDLFIRSGEIKKHKATYIKFTSEKTFKVTTFNRICLVILTLAKTVFSLGLALFMQRTRDDWSVAWQGKRTVTALIAKSDVNKSEKSLTIKQIALKTVHLNGRLQDLPECLQDDEDVTLAALKFGSPNTLQNASTRLRGKENVVIFSLEKHGNSFQHASEDLRRKKTIALLAVKNYGDSIDFISSEELRKDPEIITASKESKKLQNEFHERYFLKTWTPKPA
jgi:hypothetical protein